MMIIVDEVFEHRRVLAMLTWVAERSIQGSDKKIGIDKTNLISQTVWQTIV